MIDWNQIESPLELARQLWHVPNLETVLRMPSERFQALFNRVYNSTDDVEALWQLGGATNDYLRANPGAIAVTAVLPRRLLSTNHVDARIVGLKLLNRCAVTDQEIVRAIVAALNRRDGYESCGGIHELMNLLDSRHSTGTVLDSSLNSPA